MKSADWIDRVKAAKGWPSDYKAAQELGITRSAMSAIRTGDSVTLSEETAIKVAQALGVDPAAVLIDQLAERSKDASLSSALHRVASSLCILCKVASAVVKKSRISAPMPNCPGFPLQFPRSNPSAI